MENQTTDTAVDLTFEEAVSALKLGLSIYRRGWLSFEGCVIKEMPAKGSRDVSMLILDASKSRTIANRMGTVVGYQFASSDVFRDDWRVAE